jgi:uncharacterized protein DUF6698
MEVRCDHTRDDSVHVYTGILSFFTHMHRYTDELKLYVALSSMKEWDTVHNNFDLTVFYDHIVHIMKDNSGDEWYQEIIQSVTR